jgi:shikimate kinase
MTNLTCLLVGPNGSGKTTVGRMLANFLSLKFIDIDQEIENLAGKNIATIWQQNQGKELFEQFENTVLSTIKDKKNLVFAASVNSMDKLDNRRLLRSLGTTIYLHAEPVNQYTRSMLAAKQVPMLTDAENKLEYLIELSEKMDPLYKSIADFIVATDNCLVEEVVNKIIDYLYCGIYC